MLALPRPTFKSIPVGSLFRTTHERDYRLLLKATRIFYVGDFDLLIAASGNLWGRDVYYPSNDMRVELIGHLDDHDLVAQLFDAQMTKLTDDRMVKLIDERAAARAYGPRDMPWCEPCGSYHVEPRDEAHKAELQCRA
jgi:hypothetical protein